MTDETQPRPNRASGLPVKTVRVTVLSGGDAGREVVARGDVLTVGTAEGNDLRLSDATISRFHLELGRRGAGITIRDCGSTNGTCVGTARLEDGRVFVAPGSTVKIGDTTLRVDDGDTVMVEATGPNGLGSLRGRSPIIRKLFAEIARVANANTSVLLVGESGTGKELIARAIHAQWGAERPFVTFDCGSTIGPLFASELFGHERSAFTGADRRRDGAFSEADGGILFLDEVGEIPLETQPALLGVLERRRFRRLGGNGENAVNVRVISATNRDLRGEVNAGRFRSDLYYRLAVVTLTVPPLRERREDIPVLVEHFLREAGHDGPVSSVFSPDALAQLEQHSWPGNVRELRNVVESMLVMGTLGEMTEATHALDTPALASDAELPTYKEARRRVLDGFERQYLTALLTKTGGNVRHASRVAQMDRSYLMKLLKEHRLP